MLFPGVKALMRENSRGSQRNPVKCLRSTEGNTEVLIPASILFTDPGLTYED